MTSDIDSVSVTFDDGLLTPEGSNAISSIYVFPYRALLINFDLDIFSAMNINPGATNHFQKLDPCIMISIQNGTYNIWVQ